MIAPVFFPPDSHTRKTRPNASDATRRRKAQSRKRSYAGPLRICLISLFVVTAVVGYLFLMTRVQALDNREIAAQTLKENLQEESIALQDRVAALESRDRLFAVAARMGMRDPAAFVVVNLPSSAAPGNGHASMIASVAGWLHLR